jgi:hypothetical protein
MRVPAILCSLTCAATMAWMLMCNHFRNTYFRPVHSAIEKGLDPYHAAVEAGTRLWQDAFVPSMVALAFSLAFAVWVAASAKRTPPDSD